MTYDYVDVATQSLTIGFASIDITSLPNDTLWNARLEGLSGFGARYSGKSVALSVAYAGAEEGGETLTSELSFGPRIAPYSYRGTGIEVGVRIPIQLTLGYDYLRPDSTSPVQPDLGSLHFGRGGIGVGIGLDGIVATGSSTAPTVSGQISFGLMPGIVADFSDEPFGAVFAQRSGEVNVEIRASALGGSSVGLALGYTLQFTSAGPMVTEEVGDVLDAVSADGFEEQRRIGMLRVGLAF